MKKIFTILMVCVLALSCIACAKTEVNEAKTEANMVNPMVESSQEGILEKIGISFNVPSDATNVKYYIISDEIAEMQFNLGVLKCSARCKSTAEFEDISGLYYDFDIQDEGKVGYNDAKLFRIFNEEKPEDSVDLCLWYDAATGLMYSVSALGDNDGFDITAVANEVYVPMQGDVG